MGLNILKWLIPIVMELFKSNGKYQNYFKRNKTISLLIIACLVCIAFGLFFFENSVNRMPSFLDCQSLGISPNQSTPLSL